MFVCNENVLTPIQTKITEAVKTHQPPGRIRNEGKTEKLQKARNNSWDR